MNILNLELSNRYLIKLIQKEMPFIITRLGVGSETFVTTQYKQSKRISKSLVYTLGNNAGIYCKKVEDVIEFCNKYMSAIKNSTALATWSQSEMMIHQRLLKPNIPSIHTRVLEPFYLCSENQIPWSHYLKDKKVLIVSPFVDSIRKQNESGFQIFSDGRKLFLDGQTFVYYKAYNTSAGNYIHKNWIETFDIMCKDIMNLDFDIALLGCGGYGLPLCDFIKNKLVKSAIYIGGGLQMMFGVMGNRWEKTEYWKNIIKIHNPKFIRPSGSEILKNCNKVENACYW